jgi:hypothetical protein
MLSVSEAGPPPAVCGKTCTLSVGVMCTHVWFGVSWELCGKVARRAGGADGACEVAQARARTRGTCHIPYATQ